MAIALANAAFVAVDMQLLEFGIDRPIWFSKVLGYLATGAAIVAKFTVDYKKWQQEQALEGFVKPLSFKSMDDYLDPNVRNNLPRVKNPLPAPPPFIENVSYNSLILFTKNELTVKLAFWRNEIRNCKTNDVNYRRYQTNISNIETRIFDLDRMNSKP